MDIGFGRVDLKNKQKTHNLVKYSCVSKKHHHPKLEEIKSSWDVKYFLVPKFLQMVKQIAKKTRFPIFSS